MYKKGRVNSNSRIISTDEDPSLRIESSANSGSQMDKLGTQCSAFGCSKRKKSIKNKGELCRSESEGSADEESGQKRKLPRTFQS